MPISEREAVACLRVIVCMARVDGQVQEAERAVLEDLLHGIRLPAGVSAETLLQEDINLEYQLAQITTALGREQTFLAAYSLAYADRECSPQEVKLLARIKAAFSISEEKARLWQRLIGESRTTVMPTELLRPISDPGQRRAEMEGLLLRHAVLGAVLSSSPVAGLALVSDMAVVSLQVKLIRDLGRLWGRELDAPAAKSILYAIGGSAVTRVAVGNLAKEVPAWEGVTGARTTFITTWVLGLVVGSYLEGACSQELGLLKQDFRKGRPQGEEAYQRHGGLIDSKRERYREELKSLGLARQDGAISQGEYDKRIAALL